MKEIYITILYVMEKVRVCPNAYLTNKKTLRRNE